MATSVACYGNPRAASRVIDNDGRKITSQGGCHGLENNVQISVEVGRRITGKTYSDDMQITTGNAANCIAFRNAVFRVGTATARRGFVASPLHRIAAVQTSVYTTYP